MTHLCYLLFQYSVVIGGTASPVCSVGRAPDSQVGSCRFEFCTGHTFTYLIYFNSAQYEQPTVVVLNSADRG